MIHKRLIYQEIFSGKKQPLLFIICVVLSIVSIVAVTGLKIDDERLNDFKYKYFLLDNDRDAKSTSIKLLLKGNYVFNWTLFLKDHKCNAPIKDVNDFIIHNQEGITELTFEMLEPYFTKNLYDKIYFV